jgi:hypothetical protein
MYDIHNFVDNDFTTSVAIHFNSEDHNLNDFSSMPLDIVEKKTTWNDCVKKHTGSIIKNT